MLGDVWNLDDVEMYDFDVVEVQYSIAYVHHFDGKQWDVRDRERTFTTEAEAEEYAARRTRAQMTGHYVVVKRVVATTGWTGVIV